MISSRSANQLCCKTGQLGNHFPNPSYMSVTISSERLRKFVMAISPVGLAVLLMGAIVMAQIGGNGVVQGTITDQSGAVVTRAEVVATNVGTGVKSTTQSTNAGFYVLSALAPGEYTVVATAPGFRTIVQEHVVVKTITVLGLNFTLQLGNAVEVITVTSEPPAIDTTDGTLGATISQSLYAALPLALSSAPRDPDAFIYLLPGVSNGSGFVGNINGGEGFSKEIYIGGVPLVSPELQGDPRNLGTGISVDAIQEFKVETNGSPAQYDGQGVENFVLKSGTNSFHGRLFEYLRNTVLDARGFFATVRPVEHQNEFGASVGGPILKKRLFFFANYDGYRLRNGTQPSFGSLPTAEERVGDFSALPVPIFDPATTACNSQGQCTRQQFPGNVIPSSRISSISNGLQGALPVLPPNSPLQNNFLSSLLSGNNNDALLVKIDASISDKQQLYGVFDRGKNHDISLLDTGGNTLPLPYTASRLSATITHLAQLRDTYLVTPRLLNQISISYNRFKTPFTNVTTKGNWPQKVGLSGLPAGATMFPSISFNGPTSPTGWATGFYTFPFVEVVNNTVIQDNVEWTHGNHSLVLGAQVTWQQENASFGPDLASFEFSNLETAGFDSSGNIDSSTGNSYASFLLGQVDLGDALQDASGETGARYRNYALYAQDNWKVNSRLTVNLGLRYTIPKPYYDVKDHWSFLNPTIANPAAGGRPGILQFAGNGTDSCHCSTPVRTHYKDFGPRIGFAFALNNRTVARGAYGIFYINAGLLGGNAQSRPSNLGFAANPLFTSLDGGQTPAFDWANGFPAYQPPPFFDPTLGTGFTTTTPQGGSIAYADPELGGRAPYYQNWNLTLQRAISNSLTLTAAYAGSKGSFLPTGVGRGIWTNQLDPKYLVLRDLLTADATPGNLALAQAIIPSVTLPFPNFQGSIGQALLPFPQYSVVRDLQPDNGSSSYHSFQASAQQRLSHGLQFLVSLTLSKTIDDAGSNLGGFFGASGRTAYNNRIEKAVSVQDIPKQLVTSFLYELPFGPNKPFLNHGGALGKVVGGWQFSGILSYIQGVPLGTISATGQAPFTGAIYADLTPGFKGPVRINGNYGSGDILGSNPPTFINPAAFQDPASFTLGDSPRTMAYGLRNPPLFNENFSLQKLTRISESKNLEFRAEFFNAFNRVQFGCIGTFLDSSDFGQVGCQANTPRVIQFGLNFNF